MKRSTVGKNERLVDDLRVYHSDDNFFANRVWTSPVTGSIKLDFYASNSYYVDTPEWRPKFSIGVTRNGVRVDTKEWVIRGTHDKCEWDIEGIEYGDILNFYIWRSLGDNYPEVSELKIYCNYV